MTMGRRSPPSCSSVVLVCCCALFFIFSAVIVEATTVAGTLSSLEQIKAANSRIYAAGVSSFNALGARNDATGTIGADDSGSPILPSSSQRGNFEFDHLVVSILVQSLITRQILPQPDSTLPSSYFPRGVTLVHPGFTNVPMTLRQLLTHTTGLQTNSRFDPSPTATGVGNSVTDLVSFCDYFVTATTTGYTQANDIWVAKVQPGLVASYRPSRANTVLLAYIVQQAITTRPSLVTSAQKTVGTFAQEFVINGMGLSTTYFLLPDGSVPKVQLGLSSFTGSKIAEHTANGQIATSIPIHPALLGSGVMLITSAADISTIMTMLFIQGSGTYTNIGVSIVDSFVDAPQLTKQYGITKLGFGVNQYSPQALCDYANAAITAGGGCAPVASPFIVGYTATGTNSITGAFCTDYEQYAPNLVTTNAKRLCTAVAMSTNPVAGAALSAAVTVIPAAIGAANEVFVDPALVEGSTITEDDQKRKWDYGLLTFGYICAILLGIFTVAYFAEYYVQPMPVVGHLSAGAYPTMDEHLAKSVARSRRGL